MPRALKSSGLFMMRIELFDFMAIGFYYDCFTSSIKEKASSATRFAVRDFTAVWKDNGLGLAFDFLGLYHSNCLLIPDTKVRLYFQIK
jgi:hypothetical protein